MALADVNGYKALWHPYDGYNLPYRLLFPYDYANNPTNDGQGYPLFVYISGANQYGTDNLNQLNWGVYSVYNSTTENYQSKKMFVLIPQFPYSLGDYYSSSIFDEVGSFYYQTYGDSPYIGTIPNSWNVKSILDCIIRIRDKTIKFYTDTEQTEIELTVNINPNKIIMSGASFGGFLSMSFLREGRDVFSVVIPALAGQFSSVLKDYYNIESQDYDEDKSIRLFNELQRSNHITTILMVGQSDTTTGYANVQGISNCLNDIAQNFNIEDKSYLISFEGVGHSDCVINSIFNLNNIFNSNSHLEQQLNNEDADIALIDYILSIDKVNTPQDPFPLEEETYYPNRNYLDIVDDLIEHTESTRIAYRYSLSKENRLRHGFTDIIINLIDNEYVVSVGQRNYFRLKYYGGNNIYKVNMRKNIIA